MDGPERARSILAVLGPLLLLLAVGAAFGPLPASAEEGEKKGEGKDEAAGEEETSPLEACDDKTAKTLAAELNKARKKKNANDVLPVLEKIEDLRHEEFEKPLLKLLKHPSSLVAVKTAEMWEWRNHKKVARKVWAATWGDRRVNKRRYAVNALVLKSWPRAGLEIEDKAFKEIKSAWRWIVGNPNPTLSDALGAMSQYAGIAKDKRFCKMLAQELSEPGTDVNVNDPNNPPQAWWERKWKLWKASKPAIVAALKDLTGQEFDKTSEAKKWFEENEKTFGFEW